MFWVDIEAIGQQSEIVKEQVVIVFELDEYSVDVDRRQHRWTISIYVSSHTKRVREKKKLVFL